MKYTPYKNWTKSDLNSHLKHLCNVFDLGISVKTLVEKALVDICWNPLLDYDGCTLVQDAYHPCLSCFIHDYLWVSGQGGKDADQLFFYLMVKEGFPVAKARRRYYVVRLYWLCYAKWLNISKKNLNLYSQEFKDVLNYMTKN